MAIKDKTEFESLEVEWRHRLSGRSLVVEADIDPDLAIDALRVLSSNIGKYPASDWERRKRLYDRYRAVLAVGLCSVASTRYDSGVFWPKVPKGLSTDANRQRETGEAFRKALSRMGLSRFTTPHKYVGEILMHAGVPLNSVADLVSTTVKWDVRNASGDARGFIRWTTSMSQQVAVTRGFDVPTYRFLTEGGEVAEDFIERVIEAVDSGGASSDLPPAISERIVAALEDDGLPGRKSHTERRRRGLNVPSLTYNPNHGVRVRLPNLELEIEEAITWTVLVDGTSQRVDVAAPWPGDPVEPKWAPVRTPQRSVTVGLVPGNQHWDLELIDSQDPLLIFDGESGRLIPERVSLPRDIVWLAFPTDGDLPEDSLEVEGDFTVVGRGATPHGWLGWTFVAVDTTKVEKIRLRNVGNERWRYVTTIDRPRLDRATDDVPYLATVDGDPVRLRRPRLLLPGPQSDGGSVEWNVLVSDRHGNELTRTKHFVSGAAKEVEIWTEQDPVLGHFVITVRGPLGRGSTLRVAVAEEVDVQASTAFRWISPHGLDPATISISGNGVSSPIRISLGASERRRRETLAKDGQSLQVIGKIPYLSVSQSHYVGGAERIVPMLIDIEELPNTTLQVCVPDGTKQVYASAVLGRQVLQTLEGSGSWGSSVRTFNLAALAGTLAEKPYAELRLVVAEVSAPIALIRPRQLAQRVCVDDFGLLKLVGKAEVDGLVADFYPKYAPWKPPYRVEISEGKSEVLLPAELRNEGEGIVVLSVTNPWIASEAPSEPDFSGGNAHHLRFGELVDTFDPVERGFRPWLAGYSACPKSVEALPIALHLYSLLKHQGRPELVDRRRTELAEAVRANRTILLESVLETSADLNELMRLLVEADVVTVPREEWRSSDGLWALAPGLGVISDTDELGGEGEPVFRNNLEEYVGEEAIRIIDEGSDPAASVGRFDHQADIMRRMPREQLSAIVSAAGLIPKTLLDQESRALSSFQLLDVRDTSEIRDLRTQSDALLSVSKCALRADLGAFSAEPVKLREYRDGLSNLPALSLAMAMVARTAARGNSASTKVFGQTRKWFAKLAAAAPRIVHQDLALAELWITRWETQNETN